jgi:site-specific DNA-methyltransferase (adenine-specific)
MNEPIFPLADVLDFCRTYEGEKFHACLCDPPYHLTSIVKRFGGENAAPAKGNRPNDPYRRTGTGFMGKQWDGGDIAFRPETWEAIASVLHPGAFLFCFAGTRGYHRQAVAMEDAGLVILPAMVWITGQGFPKATRIAAKEYEETGQIKAGAASPGNVMRTGLTPRYSEMLPRSETARIWAGHRYGGQALKPACEFIVVAQVPYRGKPAECIVKTGAGALNIAGGRISADWQKERGEAWLRSGKQATPDQWQGPSDKRHGSTCADRVHEGGRWPSNVLLDTESAARLDEQSGVTVSKSGGMGGIDPGMWNGKRSTYRGGHDDSGGASRFYHISDYQAEQIEAAECGIYQAKAGRVERDAGLEAMPLQEVLDRGAVSKHFEKMGNLSQPMRNSHACVKPLRLTRYLASLLLPPAEYAPRRLYVPFSGSGSEALGGMLAGWEVVIGVEREAEYLSIAQARAKFWSGNCNLFEQLTAEEDAEPEQIGFDFEDGT